MPGLMRMRRRLTGALAAGLLALAALGPTAARAGLSPVIGDCQLHATLTRHYSIAQLQHALSTLPPIVSEYTGCADVIRRQLLTQLAALHGGRGNGGGGSSFLPAWLIAVLAAVVLAGGVGATVAARRRSG